MYSVTSREWLALDAKRLYGFRREGHERFPVRGLGERGRKRRDIRLIIRIMTMRMNEYRFKVAIGPVWSSWGWKYWSLLCGTDMIVPYPYGTREAVWLMTNYAFKRFDTDPGMQVRTKALEGVSIERFLRERDAHRIDATTVKRIEVMSGTMQNRIRLENFSGKKKVYTIMRSDLTDRYRRELKELYPAKYIEVNFPIKRDKG